MLPINYGILINKALKVKINLLVYLIIISLNLYIISDIIIKYIIKDKNKEISKNDKDILTIQSSSVIV